MKILLLLHLIETDIPDESRDALKEFFSAPVMKFRTIYPHTPAELRLQCEPSEVVGVYVFDPDLLRVIPDSKLLGTVPFVSFRGTEKKIMQLGRVQLSFYDRVIHRRAEAA